MTDRTYENEDHPLTETYGSDWSDEDNEENEDEDFDYFDLTDEEIKDQPFDLPFPGENLPNT